MEEYLANTNPYVNTYYDESTITFLLIIIFMEVTFISCILGDMFCFRQKEKDDKRDV